MEKKFPEIVKEIRQSCNTGQSLRVIFQDEARFGRISSIHSCWCPKPLRPLCRMQISQQYVYAYGAVSIADGKLESLILSGCNTRTMQIFLEEISSRHREEKILMVMDGAGWHKSKELVIPDNMAIAILPAYSPELNPVEQIWKEIRMKGFYNRIFDSLDALEDNLLEQLCRLENDNVTVKSIMSWQWLFNAIMI